MNTTKEFFVFSRSGLNFALPLEMTEKVIMAQEVIPTKSTMNFLLGVINYLGTVIPVVAPEVKFSVPLKDISINDRFVLISQNSGKVALISDTTGDIIKISEDSIDTMDSSIGGVTPLKYVNGSSGIIYIYNPELIFNNNEIIELSELI